MSMLPLTPAPGVPLRLCETAVRASLSGGTYALYGSGDELLVASFRGRRATSRPREESVGMDGVRPSVQSARSRSGLPGERAFRVVVISLFDRCVSAHRRRRRRQKHDALESERTDRPALCQADQ
jgi:hypothetical protein